MKKLFALKYLELTKDFPQIRELQNREFAFFIWDKNYMIRHQGYINQSLFLEELKRLNPRHIYASAAIYDVPIIKKMSEKGWRGCDFVVDIDSDHMDLPCQDKHDYHFCQDPKNQNCSYYNTGTAPEKCPECEGKKFTNQKWLCDDCIEISKNEVFKLINDFLIPDLGFELEDIEIVFSGHRGYHLHIYNDKIRKLSSNDRRQVVDFLTGTGLNQQYVFKMNKGQFMGSKINDLGWRGKIARKFHEILRISDMESFYDIFKPYNIGKKILNLIFKNRKYLLNKLNNENINWSIQEQGMGPISWQIFIEILKDQIGCKIDIPVSIDIHRLIRLEGSIHGKTGFLVKPIKFDDLKKFDPFDDPVVFSDEEDHLIPTRITAEICPAIRIKDNIYGPYNKDEKIRIPEAVAIFLACKNVATIETK